MTTFIPYQVDYSVKNVSKMVGFSKKKVTFNFGFANRQAVDQNLTGAACRGSEHQLTFVWSLKTGKRQLFVDGREVHFSESGQNGWTADRAWQHTFRLKDSTNQGLKVHFISQPVNREVPGSRPFDLRISGTSFFSFNQIFQLGTPSMVVRGGPRGRGSDANSDAFLSPEERRMIAQAKLESLKDMEKQNSPNRPRTQTSSTATTMRAMNRDEGALISFDEDPAPAVPPQTTAVGGAYNQQFASSITLDTAIDDSQKPQGSPPSLLSGAGHPFGGGPPPPANNAYGAPGYGANPYAPAPAVPQQTHPYGAPPPVAAAAGAAAGALTTYQPPAGQAAPNPYASSWATPAAAAPGPTTTNPMYASPGAQSYGGQSTASYGSAPSFAQPPPARQAPPAAPYQQSYPPQQPQPYAAAPQPQPYSAYPPAPPPQQQHQQHPPAYHHQQTPPQQPPAY